MRRKKKIAGYEDTAPSQKALETWAEKQLVRWRELHEDDWRFRWKDEVLRLGHGNPNLPVAACIYEAARESEILRGWSVLAGRIRRNRNAFDSARLAEIESKSDTPSISGAPTSPWDFRLAKFRGIDSETVERRLCQAIEDFPGARRSMNLFPAHEFLARFGADLAANVSFAELWRSDRERVINTTPKWYSGMLLERGALSVPFCHPGFREGEDLLNDGLRVAWERVACFDDMISEERRRKKRGDFGNEAVVFSIHWRAATNKELAAEFLEWLRTHRPPTEPEPPRHSPTSPRKLDEILRCLRVMRLRQGNTDAKVLAMSKREDGGDEKEIGRDGRKAEQWCREVFCFGTEPKHAKQGGSK